MRYFKIPVAVVIVSFITLGSLTFTEDAEAQERPSAREWQAWQDRWNRNDEGGGVDEDDIHEWRTRNSEVREAIEDLDEDEVEKLPLPVLFGVALSDLFPNFGDPRDGGTRQHEGLDILAPKGTPVVSPTEAVVTHVGNGSSSGNYVTTANPGDESFVYMHLDEVADLKVGDELKIGDLIGFVGNTGNAAGGSTHLHFEIREDREPEDPFKRLTKEFSLEEKMDFLKDILKDVDDAEDLADSLVQEYLGVFLQARALDIPLPSSIEEALPASVAATPSGLPIRDLMIGSTGTDVLALQSVLIAQGYLVIDTPTEYFGSLTQAALASYQRAHGVVPASGYYGPATRASFGASTTPSSDEELKAALTARIAELTALLAELKAKLGT
jgi:hypothetical protein